MKYFIYLRRVMFIFHISLYRFIYTGEVFVPQHELKDFLRTAELLEIKGLLKVNKVGNFFVEHIQIKSIYLFSKMK